MGGSGSGHRWSKKSTTSDYLRLDVRSLQRSGFLKDEQAFCWQWSRNGKQIASINIHVHNDRAVLWYKHRDPGCEWQEKQYSVTLERTSCNYGGSRTWFLCPARGCGRRVAILYGGDFYACRHCHQLAYDSQREAPHYRALYKAQALSFKLGAQGCVGDPVIRPKGMHRRTFRRLKRRYEFLTRRMNSLALTHFGACIG